jgi:hypothetical protein
MTIVLNGSTGITTPTYNGTNTAEYLVPVTQFKNRIINGAMVIDQRNAGAAVTTTGTFAVDRWLNSNATDGAFSAQQDSSAPAGFINSVKITTTTADASLGGTQGLWVQQNIEGNNVADLGWGTANAKTITLSFWVRSSLTGTFGGALANSAYDRGYAFTYTISAANTWEQKSVTISGDTSGTWLTTKGIGIRVQFGLGVGSTFSATAGAWSASLVVSATGATSVIGTLNATWYVTGVQLEVGSTATSFDYRPYGTELALCQRYYYRLKATAVNYPFGFAQCYSTTLAGALIPFPVTMRTAPSALEQSGTAGDYAVYSSGGSQIVCTSVPAYAGVLTTTAYGAVNFTVASSIVAGDVTQPYGVNANAYLGWSAEL